MSVDDRSVSRWERLAAVARERASEESAKSLATSNMQAAGLHMEQQAYLERLAEVYELRARECATP